MTKLRPCNCTHAWQDRTYGPGQRVHNYAGGNRTRRQAWRCTVCGAVKEERS